MSAQSPRYVPGQLLVRYREPIGTLSLEAQRTQYLERVAAVEADYGLRPLSVRDVHGPELVAVPTGDDPAAVAARLERDPRVAYAEPNYYVYPLATVPSDPLFVEQWNMTGFGMPQAWDFETGSAGVTVAVIDSGIDLGHDDLAGRLLPGYDFYYQDENPSPGDPANFHGTHVAGIVAANGNNGIGVAGVAYTGVKILPVKVFDDTGGFNCTTVDIVADAIRWSIGTDFSGLPDNVNPAQILNLSLGMPGVSQALNEAVRDARDAGAVVISASGNDFLSNQIFSPANSPGAMAVGSVDVDYWRSNFSNYDSDGPSVDLMAPGGYGTSSCTTPAVPSTIPGNGYACSAGTSMAAPFVAGVAALVWSQNPGLTDDQVIDVLLNSTYYDPATMSPEQYGLGVLCADRALGAATLCGQ